MRRLCAIVSVLLLVSLLLGNLSCAKTTPTPSPAPAPAPTPTDITIAISAFPFTLDYADQYGSGSVEVPIMQICEPLIGRDKAGNPIPKLATSWEQMEPTRWRFHLREGVKFHNGDAFTSKDVVEWVKWNIEITGLLLDTLPLKEAVAIDDYTVDLVLTNYVPEFLWRVTYFYIFPSAICQNRELATTTAIGTGPYKLVRWEKGREIVMEAFDGYWGEQPPIKDVKFILRQETAVRLGTVITDEAQACDMLSAEQAVDAPKTVSFPGMDVWGLRLDTAEGPDPILKDKRLRQAIAYSIDKKTLVDNIYMGYATLLPSNQPAIPGWHGYNPDLPAVPYDLEKAKALVQEAGAVGKEISLVGTTGRYPKDREFVEAIGAMIAKTGLKVAVATYEPKNWGSYILTNVAPHGEITCDIAVNGAGAEYPGIEVNIGKMYKSGGAISAYNDPVLDKMVDEAFAEEDPAAREQMLREILVYGQEEFPVVWIAIYHLIWGLGENVEWDPAPDGKMFLSEVSFSK
ncbi:ABC transporter substrate-binding protein [Chloroflexota bacterium]